MTLKPAGTPGFIPAEKGCDLMAVRRLTPLVRRHLLVVLIGALHWHLGSVAAAESPSVIRVPVPSEQEKRDSVAIEKQVQLVWGAFRQALARGDAKGAVLYISPESRPEYLEALLALGDEVRELPNDWAELKMVQTYGQFATFAVSSTVKGDTSLHLVRFVREANGRWLIDSF